VQWDNPRAIRARHEAHNSEERDPRAVSSTDGLDMRMTLSPDERTLFMAGSAGIVVVPLGGS
jgi:hypothetical protein